MTASDDSILAVLERTHAALNITGIHINCHKFNRPLAYNTVKRRIPKLLKADLVRENDLKSNYYEITDNGSRYLDGDYTPRQTLED